MSKTITKLEYLKLCVSSFKAIDKKNWYITAFTIPVLKDYPIDPKESALDLRITASGIKVLMEGEEGLELVTISDYKRDKPLLEWQEVITIDPTWLPNVKERVETVVGRLLVNTMVFARNVGDRIPYYNKPKFSVKEIELMLTKKTKNPDKLTPTDISVEEMIACIDGLNFFIFVSTFSSVAATPKTITAPPGAKAFRDNLLKEYGEDIKDPVKLVELEDKLAEFDSEYLKDDPAAAAIFGRKARASRTKTHYIYGKGLDFIDSKGNDTLISKSLAESIENDPKEFSKHMNDLRYASYSRGGSTALAGYAYKVLQRSLSGISIVDTPCKTTKGFAREIKENQVTKFVGRSVLLGNKWVTLDTEEEVKKLVGKVVTIRSSLYCTSPKNTVCYKCMGESYKGMESGINNLAATMSSIFLNMFLKLMHSSSTEVQEVELNDMIS